MRLNININIFEFKNKQVHRIYLSEENFENHLELLSQDNKSHSLQ